MRSCSGDAKGEPACTGRSGRRGHALVRLHGGTTSALLARRLDAAGDSRLGRILGEVRGVQAVADCRLSLVAEGPTVPLFLHGMGCSCMA